MQAGLATIAGLVVALGGILGGLLIEGGKIKDVSQFTAALIVLGGTSGAVMVSTPLARAERRGLTRLKGVFLRLKRRTCPSMIEEVIGYATKARKNGLVSLEQEALDDRRSVSAKSPESGGGRHGPAGDPQDAGTRNRTSKSSTPKRKRRCSNARAATRPPSASSAR